MPETPAHTLSPQTPTSTLPARDGALFVQGGRPLSGEVAPAGAKNAALPLLAAAALGERPSLLRNVPLELNDVQVMLGLLRSLGAEVRVLGPDSVEVGRGQFGDTPPDATLAVRIRYSLLMLGVAAALGRPLELPRPGGCDIGERGYDLHLLALRALGASLDDAPEGLRLAAGRLAGAPIEFRLPTTGGTENALLAAVLASGDTELRNANTRPEIAQMAELLNRMGARVQVGKRVVRVTGVPRLPGGAEIDIMPGWDEAVTYMVAAAITGGEVRIRNVPLEHVRWDVLYLTEAGVSVFDWGGDLFVARRTPLKPFDLLTGPPPCLNSDMQPVFAALALFCAGETTLTDTRFLDRFAYTAELRKFGAQIDVYGNSAVVDGRAALTPTRVRSPDLRGGAACVLTALGLAGESVISNAYQLFRGYPALDAKLQALGAQVSLRADPAA
jgi:UDP-N-acetylglucosamine 1-carboxyvinyltransferase